MNQAKLEVVTNEMDRINLDILGISKLKWTWSGEFRYGDHTVLLRTPTIQEQWSCVYCQ